VCVVMVVGPFAPLRGSLSPQTSHGNMSKGDAAGSATVAKYMARKKDVGTPPGVGPFFTSRREGHRCHQDEDRHRSLVDGLVGQDRQRP
jgi:hypothetical protein